MSKFLLIIALSAIAADSSKPWPRYYLAYHRSHFVSDSIYNDPVAIAKHPNLPRTRTRLVIDSIHLLVEADEKNSTIRIGETLFLADSVRQPPTGGDSEKVWIHGLNTADWFRIYLDRRKEFKGYYKMTVTGNKLADIYDLKPLPELAK